MLMQFVGFRCMFDQLELKERWAVISGFLDHATELKSSVQGGHLPLTLKIQRKLIE